METSKDLFNEILDSGPSQGTLLLFLSRMKEDGQLERVIQGCQKALVLYPNDIYIRRLLAESYHEAGHPAKAESELENVFGQIDDLVSSYRLQAEIYFRQERNEEATEVLKVYLAHRPDDKDALRLMDSITPSEKVSAEPGPTMEEETAPPELEELPDIATSTLAEIYLEQGQLQEAIYTYEKLLAQGHGDNKSRQRLEELKERLEADRATEQKQTESARFRKKKEKLISILDSWLAKIREQSKTGISVT